MVQSNGALEALHVATLWKVHYLSALSLSERPEQGLWPMFVLRHVMNAFLCQSKLNATNCQNRAGDQQCRFLILTRILLPILKQIEFRSQ